MDEKQIKERQDICLQVLHNMETGRTALREWLRTAPEPIVMDLLLKCREILIEKEAQQPAGPFIHLLGYVANRDTKSIAQFFIQEFGFFEIHSVLVGTMSDNLRDKANPKSADGAD